jgi:oxazoline/thiazoline synthase
MQELRQFDRLEIAPHLETVAGSSCLALLGEGQVILVHSEIEQAIVKGVPGTKRHADIVAKLEARFSRSGVEQALVSLIDACVLVERARLPRHIRAFWSGLGVPPVRAAAALERARIVTAELGTTYANELRQALSDVGLATTEHFDRGTVGIQLIEELADPRLQSLESNWKQRGLPWIPVHVQGYQWLLGPKIGRETLATWRDVLESTQRRRPFAQWLQLNPGKESSFQKTAPSGSSTRAVLHLVALEIAKLVVLGDRARVADALMWIDVRGPTVSWHRVLPAHGAGRKQARDIEKSQASLSVDMAGGWRSEPALRTLSKLRALIDPLTGVVSRVERAGSEDLDWLEVRVAHFRQVATPATLDQVRTSFGRSFGKGITAAEAEVSAIAEAIERHSLAFRGDEMRRRSRFHMLEEEGAIPPPSLTLASDRQLAGEGPWWPRSRPETFDPEAIIDWSPATSLLSGQIKWLPTEFIYFDVPIAHPPFCPADSNGVAAGNTREEAILQGFLELVERDAHAIWWYNQIRRPQADFRATSDGRLAYLVQCHAEIGRDVWFLDITNDTGIPCIVAVSKPRGSENGLLYAVGAHFSAPIAAIRALNEIGQRLALLLDPLQSRTLPTDIKRWMTEASLEHHPQLEPLAIEFTPRDYGDCGSLRSDPLDGCREVVSRLKLDLLTVDLTRAELGLAVVRVVVPGLRHYWPRFRAGRLYGVPVELGWLSCANTEQSLAPPPPVY